MWTIINEDHQSFCGIHGWVSLNSSYYAMTPDCEEKTFSYDELKEFILNEFSTNLF